MTVLVTGGAGFVGLAVTEALLDAGEAVTVLDAAPLPSFAEDRFARLPGTLLAILADVRDADAVRAAMQGATRMVIAAAVTCGPERERLAPEQIVAVNVGAVATAVRLAVDAGIRRVVHLSSVAVYGAGPDMEGPLTEAMPCRPQSLYGITKLAGESTALRLAGLFGLDLVAARLGACFGPWEHDTGLRDTLSPQHQIVELARRGDAVLLDHDAVRDWLYVRDAAAAILALLGTASLSHRIYNIGPAGSFALTAWAAAIGHVETRVDRDSANVQSWAARPPLAIERLVADTQFRPRFGAAEAATDWLQFIDDVGDRSLSSRSVQVPS